MIRHIERCRLVGWAGRVLTVLGDGRMRDRAPYDARAAKRRGRGTAVRADVALLSRSTVRFGARISSVAEHGPRASPASARRLKSRRQTWRIMSM